MKRVFIGSSTESLEQAKQVANVLQTIGIEPLLWTDSFLSGSLTFEAIEKVTQKVAGGLFLLSPDDVAMVRGKRVVLPRPNVILEWSYFSAVFGRERVALCVYDSDLPKCSLSLPTDLNAITYIPMGIFPRNNPGQPLNRNGIARIIDWSKVLTNMAEGYPQVAILHGYSGRWIADITYDRWREVDVKPGERITFHGEIILYIPTSGHGGQGTIIGDFRIKLRGMSNEVVYRLVDIVTNVHCESDGGMIIEALSYNRERVDPYKNEPLVVDYPGFKNQTVGSQVHRWQLTPTLAVPGQLNGKYIASTGRTIFTSASDVTIRKQ